VPPDVTAAIFWLKNRRPNEWRDRHFEDKSNRTDVQVNQTIMNLANMSENERARRVVMALELAARAARSEAK
jgi:hypothetical protein